MFFFCKQKTAYELRISDWSSDVCSSDLRVVGIDLVKARERGREGRMKMNDGTRGGLRFVEGKMERQLLGRLVARDEPTLCVETGQPFRVQEAETGIGRGRQVPVREAHGDVAGRRSEESRVGQGCVSTCRNRW